jgi:hypothetical protein
VPIVSDLGQSGFAALAWVQQNAPKISKKHRIFANFMAGSTLVNEGGRD